MGAVRLPRFFQGGHLRQDAIIVALDTLQLDTDLGFGAIKASVVRALPRDAAAVDARSLAVSSLRCLRIFRSAPSGTTEANALPSNDFSAPFAAAKRPLNIGGNALSFGSNSFRFLPAAVKLRNIFSGSSELRIKHLPAVLGVKIRVGKLRFEADDICLRSQDLVFDRF